jgi:formylglycine-generating enzyme required for sulfatase activity
MQPFAIGLALWVVAAIAPAEAQERVRIGAFSIDRHEITIAEFGAFLMKQNALSVAERAGGGFEYAGGWQKRAGWTFRTPQGETGLPDEPAAHVTWAEARDFCAARGGRLPTAEEWRLAAYTEQRAQPEGGFAKGRTYVYPVGDGPLGMNTNRRHHVAVGKTKPGVNGLYDMGANLWEWLADRRGDEALTAGGSWWYGPEQTRAESMQWKRIDFTALYIGFRCVYP